MSSAGIFIVSNLCEPGVDAVTAHLTKMGKAWYRLNCEDFPLLDRSAIHVGSDEKPRSSFTFKFTGQKVSGEEIGAVWFRRTSLPALPSALDARSRLFCQGEVAAYLNGYFSTLNCTWMNDIHSESRATNKILQLHLASSVGLKIPATLVSNNAEEVRQFAAMHEQIICKVLTGFSSQAQDFTYDFQERYADHGMVCVTDVPKSPDEIAIFTKIVTPEMMNDLGSLPLAPVLFQEHVLKKADVRITVVGDRIYPCRIYSQNESASRVDFRRILIEPEKRLKYEAFEAPASLCGKIKALMSAAGLVFGCFDFVEKEDGEFVFLEVNPGGQWLWVDRYAGLDISLGIAEVLSQMATG